tara:strand:+ start:420 stop:575 length:156 start_codon:yes stop_codon:yes gene_type:complete
MYQKKSKKKFENLGLVGNLNFRSIICYSSLIEITSYPPLTLKIKYDEKFEI